MGEEVFALLPARGLDQSLLLAVLLGLWVRYLFAETTLVRERNRLLEALSESKLEAERLRAALRD